MNGGHIISTLTILLRILIWIKMIHINQNDLSKSYWVSIITFIHFTRQWLKCHWTFLDSFLGIYPIRFSLVVWEFHTVHSVIFTNCPMPPDSTFPSSTSLSLLWNFMSASCCPYMSKDVWLSTAVMVILVEGRLFQKTDSPWPGSYNHCFNHS